MSRSNPWIVFSWCAVDVIPTSETGFIEGFKMILRYKPFLILTAATVASILATQVYRHNVLFALMKISPSFVSPVHSKCSGTVLESREEELVDLPVPCRIINRQYRAALTPPTCARSPSLSSRRWFYCSCGPSSCVRLERRRASSSEIW